MDLPPPVQDPEPRTVAEDPLARRLDAVEARLAALGGMLEQMETSLHQVIRDEGHTVSTEIRYTLSELGRRLALDLPQTLDRHRQMIVAELRPSGPDPGARAPGDTAAGADGADAGSVATGPPETDPDTGSDAGEEDDAEAEAESGGTAAADGDATDESPNAGGRRKRRRRRGEA
ncbi:MAG: hypothetical protein QOJ69_333 [Actinomycetota bacterium]|nr:hypothetical protein [Actinomycetota bacterium]